MEISVDKDFKDPTEIQLPRAIHSVHDEFDFCRSTEISKVEVYSVFLSDLKNLILEIREFTFKNDPRENLELLVSHKQKSALKLI